MRKGGTAMARFKPLAPLQTEWIAIDFKRQILPGTFEYTLAYLVDHVLDLSIFHPHFRNDLTGRLAYEPSVLLKVVLLAYSRGVTSCREMARLCRENILFMALSAHTKPHFTTLADFVARSTEQIQHLFLQILQLCRNTGLIGLELIAVDGCKLPSNASKEWSGTLDDFRQRREKLEAAVAHLQSPSRQAERETLSENLCQREERHIAKLQAVSAKVQRFLSHATPRMGRRGLEIQSNLTDNDSARMKSCHGILQGYLGVAAVDARQQVIVHAQAYGQVQEQGLLGPTIEACTANLSLSEPEAHALKYLADAGFHNVETLVYLEAGHWDAYLADAKLRLRDPRFKDYKLKHKPKREQKPVKFSREDFQIDVEAATCICPAGQHLRVKQTSRHFRGQTWLIFRGRAAICHACALRKNCLQSQEQKAGRAVSIILDMEADTGGSLLAQMRAKLDSVEGRAIYSQRLGIVEPVFANLTETLGFKRFSYRGLRKVNAQWQLMACLHNLGKLHRYGGIW